ncbi:hypothetical protein [Heyndrickxia oleronia]|nr:hypothetical protein [Heyndrickxia oleronia]GIN40569.1 hypothetical protein J19TS1_35180 [Heyndrickxia oleronia]
MFKVTKSYVLHHNRFYLSGYTSIGIDGDIHKKVLGTLSDTSEKCSITLE